LEEETEIPIKKNSLAQVRHDVTWDRTRAAAVGGPTYGRLHAFSDYRAWNKRINNNLERVGIEVAVACFNVLSPHSPENTTWFNFGFV
jgi:hypothetical protein